MQPGLTSSVLALAHEIGAGLQANRPAWSLADDRVHAATHIAGANVSSDTRRPAARVSPGDTAPHGMADTTQCSSSRCSRRRAGAPDHRHCNAGRFGDHSGGLRAQVRPEGHCEAAVHRVAAVPRRFASTVPLGWLGDADFVDVVPPSRTSVDGTQGGQ